MGPLDTVFLAGYLAAMLGIGLWFARRPRAPLEFFLAGRSMHWFPIGLSVMTTAFSAINYTAFSGEVFQNGLYVFMAVPVFALVSVPVTRIVMPFYQGMDLCSVYEYLERRFDVRVRSLGALLFVVWCLFWMATALYVPSQVLHALTGLNLYALIALAGITVTVYTAVGGMRAVIWTDVAQFFVIVVGLGLALAWGAAHVAGGFGGILRTAAAAGRLKPFFPPDRAVLALDPSLRMTLWSCLVGTFVAFLGRYTSDQAVVQKYFTARSLRMAQRGFRLSYLSAIFALTCLALLGLVVYAHAAAGGTPAQGGASPLVALATFFRSLPFGGCGLIVAGLLAATMSSIDAGIHSCCTVYVADFRDRLCGGRAAPLPALVVALGVVTTGFACFVGRLGTVFEIANRIINGFGAPLLALFLLGMFSRRANAVGVLAGGVAGAAWSAWVSFRVEPLALHYYAVVNLLGTLLCCYAFSALAAACGAGTTAAQLEWTWAARRRCTAQAAAGAERTP
jgi:SSS family transporter